jgi:fumarate reductase flavoprotein subunit
VVGAGACGMVAALAMAKRGVGVLVLEKGHEIAGNTARSTGLIPAAGTRFQREAGILNDSARLMAEDIFRKNDHESNPGLTRLLCEESGPLVEWLVDEAGCEMVCYKDFLYPGQSRYRMHGPKESYGTELVRQLQRAVREEPLITMHTDTPVNGLLSEDGRVVGVETREGPLGAGAVLLALNGFGGDRGMVERYLGPEAAAALYFGSPNNTGEGIRWGMDLGAATQHMGSYQGHASVAAPDGPLVTWEIFDREVYEASLGTRFDEVVEAGKVVNSETLESLAGTLGLPADALAETVAETNRSARGEISDAFGREGFLSGPLEPPFHGIHVRGALFHTQGGLRVDTHARVLRPDGEHIPGLYAGGGTAVGVSGSGYRGYSSGNGLLAATVLGKVAGEAASFAGIDPALPN